jgi:RNA polymerase sigma factor (sigma-70 family)
MKTLSLGCSDSGEDSAWSELIAGDRSALEFIYKTYISQLFRYGCAMLDDKDEVKDHIQEVFIDIWKYHSSLRPTDNVKIYLFRCLSNKIYNASKDNRKRKMINEDHAMELDMAFESAESYLINHSREEHIQKKLAKELARLPMRQKEVINYLFFEDFNYEQTSHLMNINLKSVYTLAWKAISSLKKGFN